METLNKLNKKCDELLNSLNESQDENLGRQGNEVGILRCLSDSVSDGKVDQCSRQKP